MKSQKEISFEIISSLRDQGKSDSSILIEGSILLFESWKRGEWKKEKGDISESGILKYSRSLLKNWMEKDDRLNPEGKKRSKDHRGIRDYLLKSGMNPDDPRIIELEMRIMEEERKVS